VDHHLHFPSSTLTPSDWIYGYVSSQLEKTPEVFLTATEPLIPFPIDANSIGKPINGVVVHEAVKNVLALLEIHVHEGDVWYQITSAQLAERQLNDAQCLPDLEALRFYLFDDFPLACRWAASRYQLPAVIVYVFSEHTPFRTSWRGSTELNPQQWLSLAKEVKWVAVLPQMVCQPKKKVSAR